MATATTSAIPVTTEKELEDELNNVSWYPDFVTELTRRGVTDITAKSLEYLHKHAKDQIAKEIERTRENLIVREIQRMSSDACEEFKTRLLDIERKQFRFRVYDTPNIWNSQLQTNYSPRNMSWIGETTVGIAFGDILYIHVINNANEEIRYTLDDLCFEEEGQRNWFVSGNNNTNWTLEEMLTSNNLDDWHKESSKKIHGRQIRFQTFWTTKDHLDLVTEHPEYYEIYQIGKKERVHFFQR